MSTISYEESIKAAADFLRLKVTITPEIAIVAGSGLGEALEKITTVSERIPYAEIPYYPQATVAGHKGELVFGKIVQQEVLLFSGRKHIYEGESLARVVFPVFLLGELKVPRLILTNAAGGLNPAFNVGDLMLITEGINLTFKPFFLGEFPAYSKFYRLNLATVFSPAWRSRVLAQAKREGFFLRSGVYIATTGPSYETPAEVGYLRALGGDAIGMSTVPEAMAAASLGIEVLGISFISNTLAEIPLKKTTHEEVIQAAEEVASRLAELIRLIVTATL